MYSYHVSLITKNFETVHMGAISTYLEIFKLFPILWHFHKGYFLAFKRNASKVRRCSYASCKRCQEEFETTQLHSVDNARVSIYINVIKDQRISYKYILFTLNLALLVLLYLLLHCPSSHWKYPITRLYLHQFLGTKTTEANKSLKTDANGIY